MNPDLIKALLFLSAYEGARAVMANVPLSNSGKNPDGTLDVLNASAPVEQYHQMTYEAAKTQYAAILRGFQDHTGVWPDPTLSGPSTAAPASTAGTAASNVLTNIAKTLPTGSPVLALITQLIPLLGTLTPALSSLGNELAPPAPVTPAAPVAPVASTVSGS